MLKTAERGFGLVHFFVSTLPNLKANSDMYSAVFSDVFLCVSSDYHACSSTIPFVPEKRIPPQKMLL
jgi:hypothetical protein